MTNGLRELNAFDVHPARSFNFDELLNMLHAAKRDRALHYVDGPDDLQLWKYSNRCVYDKLWTPTTILARGLILDMAERRVVATPFPKFFNLGEDGGGLPNQPFEIFEKLDGSLIIIFYHRGRWRAVTRGTFESSQALWAQARLLDCSVLGLDTGATYLAEAIYPENRIVVKYDEEALVMLAGYAADGRELPYATVQAAAATLGWRTAQRHSFASVDAMMDHIAVLPKDHEGFVLRFANGLRIKLKGAEYRRIHALISRVTPLAVWEMLFAGDDLNDIRREVPEEFWGDFDQITSILQGQFDGQVETIKQLVAPLATLSDKELGLRLKEFPEDVRSYIFPCRKDGDTFPTARTREVLWRHLRPTGNALSGYVASYAMNRVMDDAL
jgi:RNA ligase